MPSLNKKRFITNAVLLTIAVALVLFVIMRNDETIALHKTLYDKSIGDEATEIIIHADTSEDVILKNENGIWKITAPIQLKADRDKVRHLFTLLSENADVSYDIQGKDLASYGLDKEQLSVTFNGVKLIFGKLNEISQKRYILKGERMYLIAETVTGLLESGVDGFKLEDFKAESSQENSQ
jgi:hypothetical protein